MRTIRATLPGSACAHDWPSASVEHDGDVSRPGARVELGGNRARRLAELDRLAAQVDQRVDPAEVEQVRGERREAARLLLRSRDALARVGEVDRLAVEVVGEQLEHAVERGQRRAQLVRRRATNARRASSCWRSRSCIVAKPRASSPISSETRVVRARRACSGRARRGVRLASAAAAGGAAGARRSAIPSSERDDQADERGVEERGADDGGGLPT